MRITYTVTSEEAEFARTSYPKTVKRIGIQFLATALCRSYLKMDSVMYELAKEYEVFLFGAPGQIRLKQPVENVVNLMEDNLTFRESAAVLQTCDACISPDSAMVHLASALEVPCVALYGPFPASLRVTGDKVAVIQGEAPCAPCFFHAERPDQYPLGMPCISAGKCIAMDSIDPMQVVALTKTQIA